MSNDLDPDLGPKCLQRLSTENPSLASTQRVNDSSKQTVQILMKCHALLHLIWVFTFLLLIHSLLPINNPKLYKDGAAWVEPVLN